MKIINEQYRDKSLYSNFQTTSPYDEITSIEYEEDGSFSVKMKSDYPPLFRFTVLKKI